MFSIIIPCRIYNKNLDLTLKKIEDQLYQNYEVIVILDFEDSNLKSDSKVKYIFSGIKTPGEKRNLGIEKSTGEFIAFLDDDAYPDSSWLENSKNILVSNPEYIGVCGPSITPYESSFLEEIGGFIYESFLTSGPTRYRHLPMHQRLVDDYPSVNLILREDKLVEVGGFDTKYWPGEDTKLCLELTKKFGTKILYSPNIVVYHFRRGVFHPHLIQLSRYASHRGYFAKIFPETSLKLSYFIPSIFLIYLVLTPLIFRFFGNVLLLIPLIIYGFFLIVETFSIYLKSKSVAKAILSSLGILFSNLTYGLFFIKGLFSKPNLILREVDIINEKYIKG